MKYIFINVLFYFSFYYKADAQFFENQLFIDTPKIFTAKVLAIEVDNASFFRNNEYFGKIVEGYTLPGFWIKPQLNYYISEKTKVSGGINILKFFGENEFYKLEPTFTLQHNISRDFSFLLGTLSTKNGHYLSEPIFNPERYYFNELENGIQFLFNNSNVISDTWLSWDQFTFYGDSVQEQITAGSSNVFQLIKNEHFELKVPAFILFTHMGGQINRPKKPIETLMNAGSGLRIKYNLHHTLLDYIEFSPEFYYYKKNTSAQTRAFNDGWGILPSIGFYVQNFYFKNSFWHSNTFVGPRGEQIYQSISDIDLFIMKTRNLYIPKIGYFNDLNDGLRFSASFEGFYDPDQSLFDYNFTIHFAFTEEFLIKTFNKAR